MEQAEDDSPRRRTSPVVWAIRALTGVMLLVAIVVGARKFRTTPEQDELTRYAELTVPAYLREVADVEDHLDKLGGASKLTPAEARGVLVDEVMPAVVRARKHATAVEAESEAVRASNAEYVAALDKLLDTARTGVRAIDDPALSGEEGHKQVRERRRAADDALRAWMEHLRDRCQRAGLRVGAGPENAAKKAN